MMVITTIMVMTGMTMVFAIICDGVCDKVVMVRKQLTIIIPCNIILYLLIHYSKSPGYQTSLTCAPVQVSREVIQNLQIKLLLL